MSEIDFHTQDADILKMLEFSEEISKINHIKSCLYLDFDTQTPINALNDKAKQLEYISVLYHQKATSDELKKNLYSVEKKRELQNNDVLKATYRELKKIYNEESCLNSALVKEKSKLNADCLSAWKMSRQKNDFKGFEKFLSQQLALSIKIAGLNGYAENPYDYYLNIYEPGMTSKNYSELFKPVKKKILEMLPKILEKQKTNKTSLLKVHNMPTDLQQKASVYILESMGFDFNSGLLTTTTHPYSITLGKSDIRVSTRYQSDEFEFVNSVIHEGGHGLYEQGIDTNLPGIIYEGYSTGIHESQSRIWEVVAGSKIEFWENLFPNIRHIIPQLKDVSLKTWMENNNYVKPNLIRVKSDPLTYGLHIIIRYEIEQEFFEQNLNPKDLPEVWNQKYKQYLGLEVPDYASGCLQDIHWCDGGFGYFPTYLYGTMVATQFWDQFVKDTPNWRQDFSEGNFKVFRNWLKKNIHIHGKVYSTDQLLRKVTGQGLNPDFYLKFLEETFS